MKKLFTLAFLCLFGATISNAQVLFFENFDGHPGSTAGGAGTYSFPAGWVRINADGRTPEAPVSYVNNAWIRREDFANNVADSCAFSTSWYSPTGQADDWMWTPAITLTANNTLLWEALAYDPDFRDGYEVRIWTAGGVPTAIPSQSTVLFSVAQENSTWTQHTQSLAAYAGQTVRIGFRNNSNDMFLLLIDNVAVFGPNDDDNCAGATPIPVGSTCNPMNFSNFGATDSGIAACAGTADDDIWFSFVAPASGAVNVQVAGSAAFDAVIETFSGTCNGLTSIGCGDLTIEGGAETSFLSGLTPGQTYFVRVFDWYQGAAPTNNFTICITSATPCSLSVPGGAVPETEACGGDLNGGCNSTPAVYQNITCGQTVSGTAWASGTNRDTDWYQFTLASAATVTLSAAAQFPFTVGFVNVANCTAPTFIANTSGSNCGVVTLSQVLQPGTYAAIILPSDFSNIPCGSGFNNYYLTLSIPPIVPTITSGGPTSFCQGGSVQLTSSQASSYAWSPSGGNASVMTASATGAYTVSVTDVNGCLATSAPVQVNVNQAPTAVLSGGGVACNGNGVNLTLTLTGQAPWNVVATNGVSQFPISNIGSSPSTQSINIAGTYTLVSVTDANGCQPGSVSGSAVVTTGVSPTASFTSTPNGLAVSFSNTSSGSPTSYSWTFGDGNSSSSQSPSHTYATGGNYNVCLTATNGCGSNQVCQQVTVSGGPAAPTNDNCTGASALTVNSTCVATSGNTANATESQPGCAGTADDDVWYSFVVPANGQAIIEVQGSTSFDAVLEAFSGSCGNLTSLGCIDGTLAGELEQGVLTNAVPGETIFLRVYHYFAAVPATTTFTICVYNLETPSNDLCSGATPLVCGQPMNGTTVGATETDAPTALCNGEDLTGAPGVWYKFSGTGANVNLDLCSNLLFDTKIGVFTGTCGSLLCVSANDDQCGLGSSLSVPTATGLDYFVYVTGFSGDFGTFTLTHDLAAVVPVVNPDGPTVFCQGNSVTLTSTPASSYSWSPTGGNGSANVVSATGSYTVTTTDFNGCQATSAAIQVDVSPAPSVVMSGGGTSCDGAGVDIIGTLTGTAPWDAIIGNGTTQFPISGITSSPYVQNVNVGGTYTVLAITDATGCAGQATGSATVLAATSPVASFTVQNLDPTVIFTDQSTGPAANISWDFGDGNTSTLQSPVHTYANPGNYNVCQTVTNDCGSDQLCQSVIILPIAVANVDAGIASIYPNPTNGDLTVNLVGVEAGSSIVLNDLTGRTVATYPILGQGAVKSTLSLGVSNGSYLIRVVGNSGASKASFVQVIH